MCFFLPTVKLLYLIKHNLCVTMDIVFHKKSHCDILYWIIFSCYHPFLYKDIFIVCLLCMTLDVLYVLLLFLLQCFIRPSCVCFVWPIFVFHVFTESLYWNNKIKAYTKAYQFPFIVQ